MTRDKLKKIFFYYICLQPVFDIVTSVTGYFVSLPVSLNILIKTFFLMIVCVYVTFFSKSRFKKISLIYLASITVFFIVYLLLKIDSNLFKLFFTEIQYFLKFFYWQILAIGYLNIFDEFKVSFNDIQKYIKINVVLYFLFLFIPLITSTSFSSYGADNMGIRGWFYSANELASLLSLLLPLVIFACYKGEKKVKNVLIIVCAISALSLIGTKTSLLSLVLTLIMIVFVYLFKHRKSKIVWIVCIVTIISLLVGIRYIPGFDILRNNNIASSNLVEKDDTIPVIVSKYLLRVRRNLFIQKQEIYDNSSIVDKFFGIGFTNRSEINNNKIEKLVEIDFADIYFSYGIVGFLIYIMPFIYLGKKVIRSGIKKLFDKENLFLLYDIVLGIMISCFAGHVFGAPSVSIYISIAYVLILLNINGGVFYD